MVEPESKEIIIPLSSDRQREVQTQQQIERLQRRCYVELEAVKQYHAWLDDKRLCRQACRVIGDSRTGKTFASDAYRWQNPILMGNGDAPIVPVIYWHATTETGQRELLVGLLENLKYRITRGTLAELRERVYRLLGTCQVEMIIIDEAHRLKAKTLSEVRDLFDLLNIAVVLVGTDRLDAVVRRDEQVHNRFMACHCFHRLDSQGLEETTAIWEEYVLRLPEPSNLTHPALQKILGWRNPSTSERLAKSRDSALRLPSGKIIIRVSSMSDRISDTSLMVRRLRKALIPESVERVGQVEFAIGSSSQ